MMRRFTKEILHHFDAPLPGDVYNRDGRLLVKEGLKPDNEDHYRELLNFGYVEGDEPNSKPPENRTMSHEELLADTGVLIADDTPLMLDMLQKSLNNIGLKRISRVCDGKLAVFKAEQLRPQLVFLDIDMPRLDGLSALKQIREDFPDIFICMLSAHSSVKNVRTALSAGASGFLVKPFQQKRLDSIVHQFMEKSMAG